MPTAVDPRSNYWRVVVWLTLRVGALANGLLLTPNPVRRLGVGIGPPCHVIFQIWWNSERQRVPVTQVLKFLRFCI